MKCNFIGRFLREEDGAAAVEYAILVAVVAGAVLVAVRLFDLNTIFTSVSTAVQGLITSATN
jgi:pilus assembly protein Flp/PilA